jgi:hypothetical protein
MPSSSMKLRHEDCWQCHLTATEPMAMSRLCPRGAGRLRLGPGWLAGVLVFTAAVACADDPGPQPAIEEAQDLESAPALELAEELRIGSLEDSDYGFSRLAALDVADQEIFVCEGTDVQIRVYALDGRLLRRIGRRGEGPGEYRTCDRFGVVGDTVWVVDTSFITMFDRAGTLLSSARYEVVTVPWHNYGETAWIRPHEMLRDGLFRSLAISRGFSSSGPIEVARPLIKVPVIRFASEGHVVDTVGWLDSESPARREFVRVGNFEFPVQRPPPARWPVALTPKGHVVAEFTPSDGDPGTFHLRWHNLMGSVVRTRSYRTRPVAYTDAMLDEIALSSARMAVPVFPFPAGAAEVPSPSEVARAQTRVRSAMRFPHHINPLWGGRRGDDGSLWLELPRDNPESPTSRWVVLDPQGTVRGGIELPASGFRLLLARDDEVWASVADDYDVPWLVRYRLIRKRP